LFAEGVGNGFGFGVDFRTKGYRLIRRDGSRFP
jgi:hypothetical protein